MSILTRLFGGSKETRNASTVLSNPASWFLNSFGLLTSSNERVTSKGSLAINAVYVSSKIIGESISTLSFGTFRKNNRGRTAESTQVSSLLGLSPDPENGVTASDSWKAIGIQLCTHGNAYAKIYRSELTMQPERLELLYPWHIHIRELNGGIIYKHDIMGDLSPDDILHFKNNSWDGIVGLNPIHEQRELMGLATKQSKYAGAVYGNKPNGYIATDEKLNSTQQKDVAEFWASQVNAGGAPGMNSTPVLGSGLKFHNIPLSPADIEYINASNLTEDQVYNLYRIPPPIRGDYERATFSNAEQAELVFMKHTILPYVINIEQEVNLKLFPISNRTSTSPLFCKFNMNSTMRADFVSRTEGYQKMFQNGIMSQNEIRALEDMNPKDNGDTFYVPLNMIPEDEIMNVIGKDNGE